MRKHYTKTPEGSYKSNHFKKPEDIYLDEYWSAKQNHSTIHEQVFNVTEKNELVKAALTNIEPKRVLEIACAPGILMGDLSANYETHGIEVDERYKQDIQSLCQSTELYFGLFPEVSKDFESGIFSNIIALDVFEHVEEGMAFLKECERLLVQGGRLIIQAPIMFEPDVMDEKQFHETEHIWIYDVRHVIDMATDLGFKVKSLSSWKLGHEQIVFEK
jgi:2-polyprenyl-3-methyl-5-hydroxy-6-metoxy-1,4-benzoquinol methylase